MAKRMAEERRVFIQAESELAAINMVFGASAAGARAMTSSSSPGISLKQEGISYLAGCELPCVIVNIMRGGPGLGNITPSQSDYFQATKGGGHGDYHCIVLAPSSVQEAFDLMKPAFELADLYRNPVYILGDGMLGQMMEPLSVYGLRGKGNAKGVSRIPHPVSRSKKWALSGCKNRKPNVIKSMYLREGSLEKHNIHLKKKYQEMENTQQRWEDLFLDDARIILVAYGSVARIAQSVVRRLRKKGKRIGLIRPISLWPFPKKIFERTTGNGQRVTFFVIEMSLGQMVEDVELVVRGRAAVKFFGRAGGGIPSEEEILKKI
jgi:2-oxoglutarate ferredoxin oxidoreductase subunit alpha